MPRKVRNPKAKRDDIKPAVVWLLVVGDHSDPGVSGGRLPGWLDALRLNYHVHSDDSGGGPEHLRGTRAREVDPHVAAMVEETKPYKFAPWCATGKRPSGPGFEKWKRQFLDAHLY